MFFNKTLWSSLLTGCVPAVVLALYQSSPICLFRDSWTVPSVTARPSLCAVPAQPDTGTGATAFPQDFKELCCVNACSYLYNYREVIDCRGRFSNSDVTHVKIQMWSALPAVFCSQPFCLAVLMMCEAHGRHCCSRSLLVFYSISPPDISSEDAIWSVCKLLCILCMYCTLIHYFFRLI